MTTSATDQIDPVPEQSAGSVSDPQVDEYDADMPPPNDAVKSVARKQRLFTKTMIALQAQAFAPGVVKTFDRRWRIGQVAEMVGRSSQSVRNRVAEGVVTPEKSESGTQNLFTLQQINALRDAFGTRPGRGDTDPTAIISFSSLKGGCGKTQLSVHFAQYMALKGYKVLFVDLDPQGSATTLHGLNPDLDTAQFQQMIEQDELGDDQGEDTVPSYTFDGYFFGDYDQFANCIQATYFPGIDLVPASMALGEAEYYLAKRISENPQALNRLRNGIHSVADDYSPAADGDRFCQYRQVHAAANRQSLLDAAWRI